MPLLGMLAVAGALIAGGIASVVLGLIGSRGGNRQAGCLMAAIGFVGGAALVLWAAFGMHEGAIDGDTAFARMFDRIDRGSLVVERASRLRQYDSDEIYLLLQGDPAAVTQLARDKHLVAEPPQPDLPADPGKGWTPPAWWIAARCPAMRSWSASGFSGEWNVLELAYCPLTRQVYAHAAMM